MNLVLLLCTVFHASATKRPREQEQDLMADRSVRDSYFNSPEPITKKRIRLASRKRKRLQLASKAHIRDFTADRSVRDALFERLDPPEKNELWIAIGRTKSHKPKPTEIFLATCQIDTYAACVTSFFDIKETEHTTTLKLAIEKGYRWAAHVLLMYGSLDEGFDIYEPIENYMKTKDVDLDVLFLIVQDVYRKYQDRFDLQRLIETHLRTPNANQKALATLFRYTSSTDFDITEIFHLACKMGNQYAVVVLERMVDPEVWVDGYVLAVHGQHTEIVQYLSSNSIENPEVGNASDLESTSPVSPDIFLEMCETHSYLVCFNLLQRVDRSKHTDTLRSAVTKGNQWAIHVLSHFGQRETGLVLHDIIDPSANGAISTLQVLLDTFRSDVFILERIEAYLSSNNKNTNAMMLFLSGYSKNVDLLVMALTMACKHVNADAMFILMEYLEDHPSHTWPALFLSINNGQEDFVEYMLSKGVHLPEQLPEGFSLKSESRQWMEETFPNIEYIYDRETI